MVKHLAKSLAPNILFEIGKQTWSTWGPYLVSIMIATWSVWSDLPGPLAALSGLIALLVCLSILRLLGIKRFTPSLSVSALAKDVNLWIQNFGLLYHGQVQFVHFADLWNSDGTPNDDPRVMFGFTIINNTPYTVRTMGVSGRVTFDGLTNTRGDVTLGTEWYQCGPFSRSEVHIYQPFSPERGRNLIERIEQKKTIRFDFPAVVLSGTIIELGQPTPRVQASVESVDVDPTAISRASAQVNVWHILPAK